uniref:Uncharacterized protein n=1 Tax=Arundo donax TaxID=35708 RepID=A0A0A9CA80_ARUDO
MSQIYLAISYQSKNSVPCANQFFRYLLA